MMMLSSLRLTTSRQCVRFLNTGRTTPNKPGFLEPGRNAHESKMREIQYKVTKVVLGNDGSGGGYGRAYLVRYIFLYSYFKSEYLKLSSVCLCRRMTILQAFMK